MVKQLLNHIQNHALCKTKDKILLAVSGGLDSMVMTDLFIKSGFSIGIAHCNFQLRGLEADGDEAFVRAFAECHGIPFHSEKFDTSAFAEQEGISIQMAARQLRYAFFETTIGSNGYANVATAHHIDDALETVILNLAKGAGLEGLQGIPVRNGHVIRPMLFATRSEISAYADANNLSWRDDYSNASDHYQRNFIRHHVVPKLMEINPALHHTFRDSQARLQGAWKFASHDIRLWMERCSSIEQNMRVINRATVMESPEPALLLYFILKPYGFPFKMMEEILHTNETGRQFFFGTNVLTVDRNRWIVEVKERSYEQAILIEEGSSMIDSALGTLEFQRTNSSMLSFEGGAQVGLFDAAKIRFPLVWRKWHSGDAFFPLGMSNRKKVSDFLIDNKIPRPLKDKTSVLMSDDKIIWVVGHRIDDRFKVEPSSTEVLRIEFSRNE